MLLLLFEFFLLTDVLLLLGAEPSRLLPVVLLLVQLLFQIGLTVLGDGILGLLLPLDLEVLSLH